MNVKKIEAIKIPAKSIAELAKKYGVTMNSVYNALSYRSFSDDAEKIREDAIKNYGGVKTHVVKFMEK